MSKFIDDLENKSKEFSEKLKNKHEQNKERAAENKANQKVKKEEFDLKAEAFKNEVSQKMNDFKEKSVEKLKELKEESKCKHEARIKAHDEKIQKEKEDIQAYNAKKVTTNNDDSQEKTNVNGNIKCTNNVCTIQPNSNEDAESNEKK